MEGLKDYLFNWVGDDVKDLAKSINGILVMTFQKFGMLK